jgi:hypothetical protein
MMSNEYVTRVRRLRRLARQARLHGHYVWAWQLLSAIERPYIAYNVEDNDASKYH